MFRSETEFVRWLRRRTQGRVGRLRLGIGDDAALVEVAPGHELVLTTDLSIEDIHFSRRLHPPRSVGHRALARSLSDIAAMGATPRFALVSLALFRKTSRSWLEQFYAGAFALAARFGVAVVGGDTALVSRKTLIDVVVAGEVERAGALRRTGARPGDQLWVSGRLGIAALGLRWLKTRGRLRGASPPAVRAHLFPEPRCILGRFLGEKRLASALIDLSDGLSTDLAHLCGASGVGARVWANRIPAPAVSAESRGKGLLDLALHGGEDYELLFTVRPGNVSEIPRRFQGVPLHHIGEVSKSEDLVLIRPNGKEEPLRPGGYDHFRKR